MRHKCGGFASAFLRNIATGCFLAGASASAVAASPPAVPAMVGQCVATRELSIAGSQILLVFDTDELMVDASQICAWVHRAAFAVSNYYGRFPVRKVRIVIHPADAAKVDGGTTYGDSENGGPLIVVELGRRASEASLDRDWVMTHEMVHLSVPSLPERQHWLEEGIATYVEPVARAQVGELSSRKVWGDMLSGMPNGLPRPGDRGLDRTPTWGRTYWGGALFCLLADIAIRQQSDNRLSLRDALRGVVKAGGTIEHDWPVARVLAEADRATGLTVLTDLYGQMSVSPGLTELDGLWQRLGVSQDGGDIRFSSGAPEAAIRLGITAPNAATGHPRPS